MTPEEKKEELIKKFTTVEDAIICVDEILKELDNLYKPEYTEFWHSQGKGTIDGYGLKDYYQSVKNELLK